jgi:hypothetical protein
MVPITEPFELVDLPPSGDPGSAAVVIPIRGRTPETAGGTDFRPRRPAEPAEITE